LILEPASISPPSAATSFAPSASAGEKLPGARHAPLVYPPEPDANR
jgi:hypothetical protein